MRLFLSALILIAFSSQVQADIINGGFEQPGTAFFTDIPAGSSALTGWTVVSGSVDVSSAANVFGAPYQGAQYLDLDGTSPGHIKQSFVTAVGGSYQLTFAYSNNPASGGTDPASANVSLSGSGVSDLLNQNITHGGTTPAFMNWILFTDTFTANSTLTTLDFNSLDLSTSIGGIGLDAVSVAAVPEPSPLLLLGAVVISLAAISVIRRRLVHQAAA
jgi:choice-of-anchor C domain-containing protein